jgi:ribonuclease HI
MLSIYTDGGSRGNPGKSACSFIAVKDKEIIHEEAKFLGIKTNNEAEYNAIIIALKWLDKDNRLDEKEKLEIEIISDSELIIKQINGRYKIKKKHLIELNNQIKELCIGKKFLFLNSRRENEFISRADLLVNKKLDES